MLLVFRSSSENRNEPKTNCYETKWKWNIFQVDLNKNKFKNVKNNHKNRIFDKTQEASQHSRAL